MVDMLLQSHEMISEVCDRERVWHDTAVGAYGSSVDRYASVHNAISLMSVMILSQRARFIYEERCPVRRFL